MKIFQNICIMLMLLACGVKGRGQDIAQYLDSLRTGGNPTETEFYARINQTTMAATSAADAQQMLAKAAQLLDDPRQEVRKFGMVCFMSIQYRPSYDSAALIDPYLDRLEKIANNHTDPIRPLAFSVMCFLQPRPPARTLAFMSAHLSDSENTLDEENIIMGTLVMSKDPALISKVIEFAKSSSEQVASNLVRHLMMQRPRTPQMTKYVIDSLEHPNSERQNNALNVISYLPPEERAEFRENLLRLSLDSRQSAETRSAAVNILKQP